MAKILGPQTIPSEYSDIYDGTLSPALPSSVVRKRYPWALPKRPNVTYSGTPLQNAVRLAFRRCVDCYNLSPETGGAVPPNYGLRSREWWYNAAGPSGLWYYDYFIQQSMGYYLQLQAPPWCSLLLADTNYVSEIRPTWNFWQYIYLPVGTNNNGNERSLIKIPDNSLLSVGLIVFTTSPFTPPSASFTLGVYQISDAWNPQTVTWNTQPPLQSLLTSFTLYASSSFAFFTLPSYVSSVALVWLSGSKTGGGSSRSIFWSAYVFPLSRRPYLFA